MTLKYRITKETCVVDGHTLYRIRRKNGELGGWIESEDNLSQYGSAWVDEEAKVYEAAIVYGDAWVCDRATICGVARVHGQAQVFGDAIISGCAEICGHADVCGGVWTVPPLYIQGSIHSITTCDKGSLVIGYDIRTVEEWLREYKNIFKKDKYTPRQIKEYGMLIRVAAEWLKALPEMKK